VLCRNFQSECGLRADALVVPATAYTQAQWKANRTDPAIYAGAGRSTRFSPTLSVIWSEPCGAVSWYSTTQYILPKATERMAGNRYHDLH